jgi:hypothetical protein
MKLLMCGDPMIRCNECGATQAEGALFCSECGSSLLDAQHRPTNVLPFSKSTRRPTPPPLEGYQPAVAAEPKSVTFVIAGNRHPIVLDMRQRILVGRSDLEEDVQPELDLTEFDGLEKGVSRMHASLEMTDQGIVLTDLDSTNGTMLNNSTLPAQKAFLLHTGDEVRLGDLLFHIFFDL